MRTSTDRHTPSGLTRGLLAALLAVCGIGLVLVGNVVVTGGGADAASTAGPARTGEPTSEPAELPGFQPSEPLTSMSEAPPAPHPARGRPSELSVPRLSIRANIQGIRVSGGVLEPPSDPGQVGWDVASALPGSVQGTTVVTGHTVHTGGGALDDIAELRQGDQLWVRTNRGRIAYSVVGITKLSKDAMVRRIPQVFRAESPGRLVLITCTDWNGVEYLGNTVVFARPVESSAS